MTTTLGRFATALAASTWLIAGACGTEADSHLFLDGPSATYLESRRTLPLTNGTELSGAHVFSIASAEEFAFTVRGLVQAGLAQPETTRARVQLSSMWTRGESFSESNADLGRTDAELQRALRLVREQLAAAPLLSEQPASGAVRGVWLERTETERRTNTAIEYTSEIEIYSNLLADSGQRIARLRVENSLGDEHTENRVEFALERYFEQSDVDASFRLTVAKRLR